jgi:IclR family mhp operon transcriptional activator
MERLQKQVRWPSSLATPDKGQMVVRETTRHRSPFVFDTGRVGMRLPMLNSSLGLAYLAACPDDVRQIVLGLVRQSTDRWDRIARSKSETETRLKTTAERGYAYRRGGHEPKTSSIAVPILTDYGAAGSLCVTFVTSALTQRQAADAFLPALRAAAQDIKKLAFG